MGGEHLKVIENLSLAIVFCQNMTQTIMLRAPGLGLIGSDDVVMHLEEIVIHCVCSAQCVLQWCCDKLSLLLFNLVLIVLNIVVEV